MPTAERAIDLGSRRAERHAAELGDEIRERRLMLGESQELVASTCRLSRGRYRRIETGRATNVTIMELDRIAAVLGLSPSIRLYPGGSPVRDAAHAARVVSLLSDVRPPLSSRIEVPLPRRDDRGDPRAWDVVLFGRQRRTAMELEMRLRDVQAMWRRVDLKRRDDPTEGFVLLVAGTRANRRVVAEFEALFNDLPRLRRGDVRARLLAGEHPPSGLLFI
jgi:transcriptional regulator with XRE-family HTH domain